MSQADALTKKFKGVLRKFSRLVQINFKGVSWVHGYIYKQDTQTENLSPSYDKFLSCLIDA